jgi:predicted  nucleic acid-binding Zn-ribbon protein
LKATPGDQQQLLAIADTDEEIRRLEHRKANLPEQQVLDEHIEIQRLVTDELVDATATKERLTAQSSRHEREIEVVDAGRKKHEGEIYAGRITNERQLEAIRDEIQAMYARKNDLEDSLLEIMEQLEEVTSLVDELTRRRAELDEQIAHLTTRRDEASAGIDTELAQLRERRQVEVDLLSPSIVTTYESLRAKRPGRVVARLVGRTCTGCQLELTAIELEEIKETAADGLAFCQQCGSIIVPT